MWFRPIWDVFVEPALAWGAKNWQGDANMVQANMGYVCRTNTGQGCKKLARGCKYGADRHEMCL